MYKKKTKINKKSEKDSDSIKTEETPNKNYSSSQILAKFV